MSQTKEQTNVVFYTPSNLDLTIFDSIKSKAKKHKLIFLIHQINFWTVKDETCKMHKESYYKILGLSPKHLNELLNILIDLKIIKQLSTGYSTKTEKGVTKFELSKFVILEPFQQETGVKHIYFPNIAGCPNFVNVFYANGLKVPSPTKNVYVKTKGKPSIEKDYQIALLMKENARLQEMILALQNANNLPVEHINSDDILPTNEPDEDDYYNVPVTPVKSDEKLYSVNLNKNLQVIYETTLPADSVFLDYLSVTIKKFPIYYKQDSFVAILNGDSVKIKAA